MAIGYVALLLHAHLPFVRHPEHPTFLEERWLFEANTESYLPLILALERLEAEAIPFRLTLSLSPTLMAMLDDPLLRRRYQGYLEGALALAEREVARSTGEPDHLVAHFHRHQIGRVARLYARLSQDILAGFARLERAGYLDLITCAATHGFLPLLSSQPETVRAQVQVAVRSFEQRFGHGPGGFWLPECGYFPGVDQILREAGVAYSFVERHALTDARPEAPRGTYAHAWTPHGVALFGRDAHTSHQVWSAEEGYPGHPSYREFYRDIGFERAPDYLGSLAGPEGVKTFSGFKYHRITGQGDQKELYDRGMAEQTAARHAAQFVHERYKQVVKLQERLPAGPPPLIVAPYDAELVGHWWFEGPDFLEQIARRGARQESVQFTTPGDYLAAYPEGQGVLEPSLSSWGFEGYADFWCNDANHWVYRHLHGAGRRMVNLARQFTDPSVPLRRALDQAARELLLAQASAWSFIMRTGTAADYARRRFESHVGRFTRIADALERKTVPDPIWLAQVGTADNIFPDLHYGVYA
jgi:1,4-alpha-glucan branching enzyme